MINRVQAYRLLPAIDGGLLIASLAAALAIRYGITALPDEFLAHILPFTFIFVVWIFIFRFNNLYHPYQSLDARTLLENIVRSFVMGVIGAAMIFYGLPTLGISPRKNLLLIAGVGCVLIFLWRYTFSSLIKQYAPLKIFLIGNAPEISEVASHISSHPQLGIAVEARPELTDAMVHAMKVSGGNYYVVIPESVRSSAEQMKYLYDLLPSGVQVLDFAALYERLYNKIPISLISELWFLEHIAEGRKPFFEILKRSIDLLLGTLLSVCTTLLLPLIALAIKLDSDGPIFYSHLRVGKNGKLFPLYKFRTMEVNAEIHGPQWTQRNDPRVTRIGKYLRQLRIDELPQAYNILKGDLSFVGPRPERPEFVRDLRKDIPFYDMRHLVKPGLSGWAQINPPYYYAGTSETIIKLQYDLFYIKNRSAMLDASVLFKTVAVLLSRRGH